MFSVFGMSIVSFDSILVRLKALHNTSRLAERVCFDSILVRLKEIQGTWREQGAKRGFDSILVRLKVTTRPEHPTQPTFRFHTGSIKRNAAWRLRMLTGARFDSILVRLKVIFKNDVRSAFLSFDSILVRLKVTGGG